MNRNNVVLVDEKDNALSEMEKLEAHSKGMLHRAFSVFIFNDKGEMLLQQRAENKYHGGGLWTNACCSHPGWNEDVRESAAERLEYEMGVKCDLQFLFAFLYHALVENNLTEHEYDYVFVGKTNDCPQINPHEVQNYQWLSTENITADLANHPSNYTVWFQKVFSRVIEKEVLNLIDYKKNKD